MQLEPYSENLARGYFRSEPRARRRATKSITRSFPNAWKPPAVESDARANLTIYSVEEAGVFVSYFHRGPDLIGISQAVRRELDRLASARRSLAIWLETDRLLSVAERFSEQGFKLMAFVRKEGSPDPANVVEWWKFEPGQARGSGI